MCKLVSAINMRESRLCGKNDSIRGSYFSFCCVAFIFAPHARLLAIMVTTSRQCLKSDTGCNSVATRAITGVLFGLTIAVVI